MTSAYLPQDPEGSAEILPLATRIGAAMVSLRHGPGEQVDAPEPLLAIGVSRTPDFGFQIDSAGARNSGRMMRNQLFVVPPNVGTRLELDAAHHLHILSVSYPGLLAAGGTEAGLPVDGDFHDLHPAPFRNTEILGIMRRLWQEGNEGAPNGSLYTDGALMQLAAILLRLRNGAAPGSVTGPLAQWRARRTIDYLKSHLNEDVSIAALASEAGLSPFHFARAFRASTGLPPYAYLRMLRAARVRELLAGTSLSVTQIASAVGYATPQALSRMFRAETGMSPTEWRNHLRR